MIELLFNLLEKNNISVNSSEYKEIFKLPIEYLEDKIELDVGIINDLELLNSNIKENNIIKEHINNLNSYNEEQENKDGLLNLIFNLDKKDKENQDKKEDENQDKKEDENYDENKCEKISLYNNLFYHKSIFSKINLDFWCKYYTNNKEFLLETQNLLKNFIDIKDLNLELNINKENNLDNSNEIIMKSDNDDKIINTIDDKTIYYTCNNIFLDDGFIDKYHYIDLPIINKFNNNEFVLQLLSYQNLSSPLFSLFIPIISLIIPFLLIKLQGHKITFSSYIQFLTKMLKNHAIGQFLFNFSNSSIEKKIYILFTLFMYFYQLYNNINCCISYYKNIKYIHDNLNIVKTYLNSTYIRINNYLEYTKSLTTYYEFNNILLSNNNIIKNYIDNLSKISEYKMNFKKIFELGHLMKCFYVLNTDDVLVNAIKYTFGFNGYINNINALQVEINKKNINFCKFIDINDSSNKVNFKGIYYATLNNNNPIKNNIKLENNIILTGPNAAGKTTMLKSILFNSILNQQIGCGFYNSSKTKIYDYIHCYINIPDTGGRDSLFQSECRKCKNILDIIDENPKKQHLCVFDELYSGTNPYEAIASASEYLKYISKLDNVNFILTTHFFELCKQLKSDKTKNYCMDIKKKSDNIFYTYKIKSGISKIKGGINVLKDLKYPKEIINNMRNNIENLKI